MNKHNINHKKENAFGESFNTAIGAGFGCVVFIGIIFLIFVIAMFGGCYALFH